MAPGRPCIVDSHRRGSPWRCRVLACSTCSPLLSWPNQTLQPTPPCVTPPALAALDRPRVAPHGSVAGRGVRPKSACASRLRRNAVGVTPRRHRVLNWRSIWVRSTKQKQGKNSFGPILVPLGLSAVCTVLFHGDRDTAVLVAIFLAYLLFFGLTYRYTGKLVGIPDLLLVFFPSTSSAVVCLKCQHVQPDTEPTCSLCKGSVETIESLEWRESQSSNEAGRVDHTVT